MAARLVAGRIGGLPVVGGHVSLEKADMAQVLNATTGLVREITDTGMMLAFVGGSAALILSVLGSERREREAFAKHREENPPRSFNGICELSELDTRIYGICLNRFLRFERGGYGFHTVSIEHIVAIDRCRGFVKSDKDVCITLIDGSVFDRVALKSELCFLTLAGVIENVNEHSMNIVGLDTKAVEKYKGKLVAGLSQTRVELLNEIGIDLVRKYFHVEDVEFMEVIDAKPRLQAVAKASPAKASLPEPRLQAVAKASPAKASRPRFSRAEVLASWFVFASLLLLVTVVYTLYN